MRLREIQDLLHKWVPHLNPLGEGKSTIDRNAANEVKNLHRYREALTALNNIDALKKNIAPALSMPFLSDSRDTFIIPQGVLNEYVPTIHNVINDATMLMQAIDQVVTEQNATTVAVELPEGGGLTEISEVTPEIAEFFKGMVGLPVGSGDERIAEPTFEGVDVGSIYYLFDLHNIDTVIFLGWMLRAIEALWTFTSRRIAEDRMLDVAVEDTKAIKDHLKKLRTAYARKLAEDVSTNAAKNAKNEDLNRIAALIMKNEKLLDERVRMIPSLKAPASVFKAFPPKDPVRGEFDLVLPAAERRRLLGSGEDDEKKKPEKK